MKERSKTIADIFNKTPLNLHFPEQSNEAILYFHARLSCRHREAVNSYGTVKILFIQSL